MIRSKGVYYIKIRSLIIPLIYVFLIFCLIFFSETSVRSALNGINLWLNIIFPSLFPFFVASELLNKTSLVRALGVLLEPIMRPLFNVPGCASFALAMGVTSGYPVGAKITVDLYNEGTLTKLEAERLLAFTNNSGPLFIFGAIAAGMFKMPELGLLLFSCHVTAAITVGLILRFYKLKKPKGKNKKTQSILNRFKNELFNQSKDTNWGNAFGEAVRNSVMTILAIGGFVIFFSVLINLLSDIGIINMLSSFIFVLLKPLSISKELIVSVISGMIEITTGCNLASKAIGVPFIQKICAISMIIGFAGFSVHAQVIGIVGKSGLSVKPYILGKFIQSIIACLYTYVLVKKTGMYLKPVYAPIGSDNYSSSSSLSLYMLIICLIIVLLTWKKSNSNTKR